MRSRAAGLLLAPLALTSLAACSAPIMASGSGPAASGCSWLSAPRASSGTSATVVLVDDSASFLGGKGQQASPHSGDLAQLAGTELARNFTGSGTHLVSFGTFDGSSSTINWKFSQVPLPVGTGDDTQVKAQQGAAEKCLADEVRTTLATAAPQSPGTDVMAALAAAGQQVQGTPAGADQVVMVTDGLSNTGCLNLTSALRQGEPASAVLASCPERAGLAPLKGVSVQLDGVGYLAGKPLSTADQVLVQKYWGDLCAALGVASPGSCVAPAGGTVTLGSTVSRLPDPAVRFPTVSSHAGTVPLPADLLFAFDSSALSDTGKAYLGVLAEQLRSQGRRITKIVGHTDEQGDAQYNLGLSRARARSVASYLAQFGFTGATVTGVGEAGPVCSPQHTATGAPVNSCRAQDRRVQIFLGG